MKGAILKMKKKYSKAVAKRKQQQQKTGSDKSGGGREKETVESTSSQMGQRVSTSSKRRSTSRRRNSSHHHNSSSSSKKKTSGSNSRHRPSHSVKRQEHDVYISDSEVEIMSVDSRSRRRRESRNGRQYHNHHQQHHGRPPTSSKVKKTTTRPPKSTSAAALSYSWESYASSFSTLMEQEKKKRRSKHSKGQQLQQQERRSPPPQHTRGRSPSIRPRNVEQGESRDDNEGRSFVEDSEYSHSDDYYSGESDESGSESDGSYSTSSSYTSFYSDDDATMEEEKDGDDDDYDEQTEGLSSYVVSDTSMEDDEEEDDYGEEDMNDQTQHDVEYDENKLRDIGQVIRNPDHAKNEDDDDEEEDAEEANRRRLALLSAPSSVTSNEETVLEDEKSLDSTEAKEFEEFMSKERQRKDGKGSFFWMLGFGPSKDIEENSMHISGAKSIIPVDDGTVGEDTTIGEEQTIFSEAETVPEDAETVPDDDDVKERLLAPNQTFDTVVHAKPGCFLNILSSNDSIGDGSYGGLRDGDILVAESCLSQVSVQPEQHHEEPLPQTADDEECGDKPKAFSRPENLVTSQSEIAIVNPTKSPQAEVDKPAPRPFALLSWFSSEHASDDHLAKKPFYSTKLPEEQASGLPEDPTYSVDETILVHTIRNPELQSFQIEKEDRLQKLLASRDDDASHGDSTINTDDRQNESHHSPFKYAMKEENTSKVWRQDKERNEADAESVAAESTSMVGSAASQITFPKKTKRYQESSSSFARKDGKELIDSYHQRKQLPPSSSRDEEESMPDGQVSVGTASQQSYKEEFELELGSYDLASYKESSSSNSDSDYQDRPRRKKAEHLDNYDISEIVHGRRKFMPKPRAEPLDTTSALRQDMSCTPSVDSQPITSSSAAGVRRERRRFALKAHRDFLRKVEQSMKSSSGDEDSDADYIEDCNAAPTLSAEAVDTAEASLPDSSRLDRVALSTWQSLVSGGAANEYSTVDSANDNSIAVSPEVPVTEAQTADALVDLVRAALSNMMSKDEEVGDGTRKMVEDKDKRHESVGFAEQSPIVQDVFQAAFDFFGMTSHPPVISKTLNDEVAGESVYRCTNFDPNPGASSMNTAKEPSVTPTTNTAPAPDSSQSILQQEVEAASQQKQSNQGSNTNEEEVTERDSQDRIPLELKPNKIWKAFDTSSIADSYNNFTKSTKAAQATQTKENAVDTAKIDAAIDQRRPPILQRKHAEVLRLKSRRKLHVSRIAEQRQEAQKDKNASPSENTSKDKPTLPYSGEATAYKHHVDDIRSRLRRRRRTEMFLKADLSKSKSFGKAEKNSNEEKQEPVEHRDDSSNTDEFFDAKPIDDSEVNEDAVKEDEGSKTSAAVQEVHEVKTRKAPMQYDFLSKQLQHLEADDLITTAEDPVADLSTRSARSIFSLD